MPYGLDLVGRLTTRNSRFLWWPKLVARRSNQPSSNSVTKPRRETVAFIKKGWNEAIRSLTQIYELNPVTSDR
jgi:hypothetical protein